MTKNSGLRIRIAKIHDGESSRLGATADLGDLMKVTDAREKLLRLEQDYKNMLTEIRRLSNDTPVNVFAKWDVGDVIFTFLQNVGSLGITVESHIKILCRDTGISRTEMKYLLRFRKTYKRKELDENVSWSTYRSLLYKKVPYGKVIKNDKRR